MKIVPHCFGPWTDKEIKKKKKKKKKKQIKSNMLFVRTKKIESIDHLVSGCRILTPIEYKERYYKTEHKIQSKVCRYYGLVSLFNGISTLFRLFNAKAILLEEQ